MNTTILVEDKDVPHQNVVVEIKRGEHPDAHVVR